LKLKPYYLGLVIIILLGLTASSAFGVGSAGTVTGGTFPACVDPTNTNNSTVKIAGSRLHRAVWCASQRVTPVFRPKLP